MFVWRVAVPCFVLLGRLVIWMGCRLSRDNALKLGRWITNRFEPLTRQRRWRNLRAFFAKESWTHQKLAALDQAHHIYLARMRTEVTRGIESRTSELSHVTLEDEPYLEEALSRGRGVLVVTGHMATWWNVPAILASRGHPVTAIFTSIAFPSVRSQLLRLAGRYGVRVAFVGEDAASAIHQAATRNEILYLTFDVAVNIAHVRPQRFGGALLDVDPGPAILALRHRMTILQAACTHRPDTGCTIRFYPPDTPRERRRSQGVQEICGQWVSRLEQEVRDHPEQWWPWGYATLRRASSNELNSG